MSDRYPGGIISKTAPTPTGPYQNGTAPGIWSLEQQMQYQQQGIWPIAGNTPPYIEDVFSTYLYTGNGSTQTITNGIDLSGKGGMVWLKDRSSGQNHALSDTVRGTGTSKQLQSNTTSAATTDTLTGFTSSGFTLDASFGLGAQNLNTVTYASWTFREQPKFFDIVTWTGNGTGDREISHNLGSAPGCIILKSTSTGGTNWFVYHRALSTPDYRYLYLNDTSAAQTSGNNLWNVTSTTFRASSTLDANNNGQTFVAYLFAHDAGGFGLTGTDNVISCGSYSGNTSTNGPIITLGYEPQWLLIKESSAAGNDWQCIDVMRGMTDSQSASLQPNTTAAEGTSTSYAIAPLATGFQLKTPWAGLNASGSTYIYIAIRRGPMKVPTSGTSVYNTVGGSGANPAYVAGFPVDLALRRYPAATQGNKFYSRLTGTTYLDSTSTAAEVTDSNGKFDYQNAWFSNPDGAGYYSWMWRRAPSFFDEVCYTGTGSATTVTHNLAAVPEMIIAKNRNSTYPWGTYHSALGTSKYVILNSSVAADTFALFPSVSSTTFGVSADPYNNGSGLTYVAYLFATCAGVSKVGSYTGTGTTLQVDCGFTAGARFVLIKRTDSTGDWYVWDSARGIVSGNDPYLLLNSTAAEVTGTDYVDTYSAGFEITSTAPAGINANGGSYIFLAIA